MPPLHRNVSPSVRLPRFLLATALASMVPHLAFGEVKFSYDANFNAQLAEHIHEPQDLASQRLSVALVEKVVLDSQWKAAFGLSAWDEASFATVPTRYAGTEAVTDDSRDLRVRDAFLQYQNDHFFLRVGNQQVVWGEAFGYFYSDIVNPKDLRYGLFGNFTDIRLQTPIVNAKLDFSELSFQAILIPKPYFNLIPSPGNDFAYPYLSVLPGVQSININRQTSLPIAFGNQEMGGRVSYLLGRFDLSAFYFSYYDRNPWYVVDPATRLPQNLVLDERHSRVQSAGVTATDEIEGFIIRVEGLTTLQRTLPVVNQSPTGQSLGTATLDDYIYVLGVDLPNIDFLGNLGTSLQWSQDILSGNPPGLFRPRIQSLASIRLLRTFFDNQAAELLYTYAAADSGQRLQFNYNIPVSGRIETQLGADVLGGSRDSEFGKTYQATRAYVLLKFYLKG